ncbi:Mbeg1-like protein [Neobacillus sp. Marseille-QA0830]
MTKDHLTDQDLKFTTDIAYLDLDILNKNMRFGKGPYSVGKLLNVDVDGRPDKIPQEHFDKLVAGKNTYGDKIVSLDHTKVDQLPDYALEDWKVVKTFDRNKPGQSGLYAVVLDTPQGLVVSFRGSEPPSELQNIQQDWLGADMGLLAGDLTAQQEDAEKFMDELKEEGYFDKYDNITFTGHSLGGNLAEHATFYAAQIDVLDRIKRTVSYDGPGFTDEYIKDHQKYIDMVKVANIDMDHYQQSLVGGLLQRVDGIDYQYAELKKDGFAQHGTQYVKFDGEGNVVVTDQPDAFSTAFSKYITSPFSQGMDRLIGPKAASILVSGLAALSAGAFKIGKVMYKDGKFTTTGKIVIAAIAVGLVVSVIAFPEVLFAAVATVVINLVRSVITTMVRVIVYDFVMDRLEALRDYLVEELFPQIVDSVVKKLHEMGRWAQKEIEDFHNMLMNAYNTVFGGLKNLFGSGQKAHATPHIKLDTSRLHTYADRLESVKGRLSSIDSDLNVLYLTEGLMDIINLAIAENLPTKGQMNRLIDYLRDTASAFETAESRIISRF